MCLLRCMQPSTHLPSHSRSLADFRKHCSPDLPLAKVKRGMVAMLGDGPVRMIARESPLLLAKAAELFVAEMAMR